MPLEKIALQATEGLLEMKPVDGLRWEIGLCLKKFDPVRNICSFLSFLICSKLLVFFLLKHPLWS